MKILTFVILSSLTYSIQAYESTEYKAESLARCSTLHSIKSANVNIKEKQGETEGDYYARLFAPTLGTAFKKASEVIYHQISLTERPFEQEFLLNDSYMRGYVRGLAMGKLEPSEQVASNLYKAKCEWREKELALILAINP
jgi:hypothetical protein